jgi:hypothetical protein
MTWDAKQKPPAKRVSCVAYYMYVKTYYSSKVSIAKPIETAKAGP